MKKVAFFDAKLYDREWFDKLNQKYELHYFESKLDEETAELARGCQAVCVFVNDNLDKRTIDKLYELGVRVIAMRCAGYSNVDFRAAYKKIHVVRVPAYSPHAVAEHAMGLLLMVNRKLHKAYNRTRDFNFNISGLTGVDLYGKTAGIIGTGKIGRTFMELCRGFGMKIVAYDAFPNEKLGIEYVDLDELLRRSDVISLHCPLTDQTRHMLDEAAFAKMKRGIFLINTSRGELVDSVALLKALDEGKIRGAGLDVYEEEADYFFSDWSMSGVQDDVLSLLLNKPNVVITSHQAFLTEEALSSIARITLDNLDEFFSDGPLTNEVCYQCESGKIRENCREMRGGRCF